MKLVLEHHHRWSLLLWGLSAALALIAASAREAHGIHPLIG